LSHARATNTWKSEAVAPGPSESGRVARKRATTLLVFVRTQLVSAPAADSAAVGGSTAHATCTTVPSTSRASQEISTDQATGAAEDVSIGPLVSSRVGGWFGARNTPRLHPPTMIASRIVARRDGDSEQLKRDLLARA
jgi:hypothetical protein